MYSKPVPIDVKRNCLMSYCSVQYEEWKESDVSDPLHQEILYVAPEPFRAQMEYIGYAKGRSSITFWWKDTSKGTKYPMMISSMDKLLKEGLFFWNRIAERGKS